MFSIGALTFLFPYILVGLLTLPVIWFLLRIVPPAPQKIKFPAVFLLRKLTKKEPPSDKTPWWLLLLRILMLAAFIIAMAEPVTKIVKSNYSDGILDKKIPIAFIIDNDWIAGQNWQLRQNMALKILDNLHRSGKNVVIIPTASPKNRLEVTTADAAKAIITQLQPQAWGAEYGHILPNIKKIVKQSGKIDTIWLTNGYFSATPNNPSDYRNSSSYQLLIALNEMGTVSIIDSDKEEFFPTLVKLEPIEKQKKLTVSVSRLSAPKQNIPATVIMYDKDGHILGQQKLTIKSGDTIAKATIEMKTENRNRLYRLKIQQSQNAGSVFLIDENWRFRPVGVAMTDNMQDDSGYLSDVFYLIRALSPYADLKKGKINTLLSKEKIAVMLLSDEYLLTRQERGLLKKWVSKGGMLIRFAGANLAQNVNKDDLLPVELRYGGRNFSGSLSWDKPQKLSNFSKSGAFAGLKIISKDDITVSKQVLAKPSIDIEDKIWARLEDNTPLITAKQLGDGHLILFHTTASPKWSNLSISGTFVEMLRKLIELSAGVSGLDADDAKLYPVKILDGYGNLKMASSKISVIENQKDFKIKLNSPAGFYGQLSVDNNKNQAAKAFNLVDYINMPSVRIIEDLPDGVKIIPYTKGKEKSFKTHLLLLVFLLFLVDFIVSLYLRGIFSKHKIINTAILVVFLLFFPLNSVLASEIDIKDAIKYTSDTYIAYVKTGNAEQDRVSKLGLEALKRLTSRRTSAKVKAVVGVNPNSDILTYFPFIYWPVTYSQPKITSQGYKNIVSYIKNGGLILFDTKDGQFGQAKANESDRLGAKQLKKILQDMPIPALEVIKKGHALTRSYYLLKEFPGRYKGAKLWVEKSPPANRDNVPSIIIGGNDWAGAWARKSNGQPLYTIRGGGERQREMAFRFGVNIIMMTLTGNYKVDQIHTKELLKRIGRQ